MRWKYSENIGGKSHHHVRPMTVVGIPEVLRSFHSREPAAITILTSGNGWPMLLMQVTVVRATVDSSTIVQTVVSGIPMMF